MAPWPGWGAIVVRGAHRERFLHAQLTCDVKGLAIGATGSTALLDASGRLQAFGLVHRRRDEVLLLVPEGLEPTVVERLERYLIADEVALEVLELPPMRIALGPEAVRLAAGIDPVEWVPIELYGHRGFVTWSRVELPLATLEEEALDALRVVSGLPRWGVEAGPGMLVTETSLMLDAVSLTKGCYLGQETVAKVVSRRGAAYAPVLLEVDPTVDVEALSGLDFQAEGRRAGRVLSWADWEGRRYLQAKLFRDLRVAGRRLHCELDDGRSLEATVVPLPLVTVPSRAEQARELHDEAVARFQADAEDEALELLERAIAVCPDFGDAFETLGVILGRHGRFEEALQAMRRLAAVDPASVMAHTNASLFLMRLGRIEEAEAEKATAASKALQRQRTSAESRERERSERAAREADRARREGLFREVLELEPGDPVASFGLGRILVESARFEEARGLLEKAVTADPDHSAAHLALGLALEGLGLTERATAAYRRGLEAAARRGDLATANRMQERLSELGAPARSGDARPASAEGLEPRARTGENPQP